MLITRDLSVGSARSPVTSLCSGGAHIPMALEICNEGRW